MFCSLGCRSLAHLSNTCSKGGFRGGGNRGSVPPFFKVVPPLFFETLLMPIKFLFYQMTYFLQCCSYKCVLSIFIYKIALQNTDFGVVQKSSKHFLISIFCSPSSLRMPLPPLQNTDYRVLHKSSKHFMISILFPPVPPPLGTSCFEQ